MFRLIVEEVKNTNHFKNFLQSQGIDTKLMTRDEILKNKMQYITRLIQFRNKTAGTFERKQFYRRLFCSSVLDRFESNKFNAYEFSRPNRNEVDYISCLEIKLEEGNVYFVYSDEKEKYVQIESEELKEKVKGYNETHGKKIEFDSEEVDNSGR